MPGDFNLCTFGFGASRRERRNEQEILTLLFRVQEIEKKLELIMFLGGYIRMPFRIQSFISCQPKVSRRNPLKGKELIDCRAPKLS